MFLTSEKSPEQVRKVRKKSPEPRLFSFSAPKRDKNWKVFGRLLLLDAYLIVMCNCNFLKLFCMRICIFTISIFWTPNLDYSQFSNWINFVLKLLKMLFSKKSCFPKNVVFQKIFSWGACRPVAFLGVTMRAEGAKYVFFVEYEWLTENKLSEFRWKYSHSAVPIGAAAAVLKIKNFYRKISFCTSQKERGK